MARTIWSSGTLEQVPTRARPHRGEDGVVVLEHGEDEHADVVSLIPPPPLGSRGFEFASVTRFL